MVTLRILGSGREVGRSGILAESGRDRFLMDYGINVQTMEVPIEPGLPLSAMLLTHAHIDHSGNIPALYKKGWKGLVYATPATLSICSLLLRDSLKVQKKRHLKPHFLSHDIIRMEELSKGVGFGKEIRIGDSTVKFLDAGHVPGSSAILLETGGKRILYTGDLNFTDSELLKGSSIDLKDIDVLISESTYSYKNHPDRKMLADSLKQHIQYTIYNNGIVLLPSFAVGRTQEMLSLTYDLGLPVHVDGMGIEATRKILSNPESVRDHNKLSRAFSRAMKIKRESDRKRAIEKPGIIITTAGMLQGGPVNFYIKNLHNREDCSMIMLGYQVEKTVGRTLLDTGRYVNEGLDIKPKMNVSFMDFSAHCGRDDLIRFFEKLNPKKLVLVHGDRTAEFSEELRKKGFDAHGPGNGQKIEL